MAEGNGIDKSLRQSFQVLTAQSQKTAEDVQEIKVTIRSLEDINETLTEIRKLLQSNSDRAYQLANKILFGIFFIVLIAMGFKDLDKILKIF